MSGAVEVLDEQDGTFVVACFRTDCLEHGLGRSEPWVSEHASKVRARLAASAHREWIRTEGVTTCPTCGHLTTSTFDRAAELDRKTDTNGDAA